MNSTLSFNLFSVKLENILPGQVPALVNSRGFFQKWFTGSYADTDNAEKRRADLANHLNQLASLCNKNEDGEASKLVCRIPN